MIDKNFNFNNDWKDFIILIIWYNNQPVCILKVKYKTNAKQQQQQKTELTVD